MPTEFAADKSHLGFRCEPSAHPESIRADALVVFVTEGTINGAATGIDRATGALLSRLATAGEITGKRYECVPILAPTGVAAGQIVVIGLGPAGRDGNTDLGTLYRAAATATRHLSTRPRETVVIVADPVWSSRHAEQAVAGAAMGMVGQDLYRTDKKRTRFKATIWAGVSPEALATGMVIADGVNLARRLVNSPPNDLYPETFAEAAAAVAGRTGMEIEIWDEHRLDRERCRAILAVGRGSSRAPRRWLPPPPRSRRCDSRSTSSRSAAWPRT